MSKTTVNYDIITAIDCAYFAGLCDGEGCISIVSKGGKKHTLAVSIVNTNNEVLEQGKLLFEGLIYLKPYRGNRPRKPAWVWYLPFNRAYGFLITLEKYLIVKKPQASLGIQFINERIYRDGSEKELAKRENFKHQIQLLNKGIHEDLFRTEIELKTTLGETEKAYFAGFFDGEGSISITSMSRSKHVLTITVVNTNKTVLEQGQTLFLGSLYPKSQKSYDGSIRRPSWAWKLTRVQAYNFLLAIVPYLRIKKPQALLAIEYMENRTYAGRELTVEEIRKRDWYKLEIQRLNQGIVE